MAGSLALVFTSPSWFCMAGKGGGRLESAQLTHLSWLVWMTTVRRLFNVSQAEVAVGTRQQPAGFLGWATCHRSDLWVSVLLSSGRKQKLGTVTTRDHSCPPQPSPAVHLQSCCPVHPMTPAWPSAKYALMLYTEWLRKGPSFSEILVFWFMFEQCYMTLLNSISRLFNRMDGMRGNWLFMAEIFGIVLISAPPLAQVHC